MSILRRLSKAFTFVEPMNNLSESPRYGYRNRTGVPVNRDRAMRISTVWSCVTVRAEDIGALPVRVVEQQGRNRIPKEAPVWLQKPNPETTRHQLFEQTSACVDIAGDAYWWRERDNTGRTAEVWMLPPSQVTPFRDPPKSKGDPPGPKRFRLGQHEEYGLDRIVHIPGFMLPGRLHGLNPIDYHAHTLGLAAAAEEYGEAFFGNGAIMAGAIKLSDDPGKENADRMAESFVRDHSGVQNAFKPGVLFGGAEWVPLTIPNDSAQFLETRKYQRSEICGIFRVPPHKIGDLERATFSNIEQQEISYVIDGLIPKTSRIEAAVVHAGMLDPGEQLRFNYAGRLRGDTIARYGAYAIGRQWGWLSVDDIRDMEDLSPLPAGAGESYLEPLNMRPVGGVDTPAGLVEKLDRAGALVKAGYDPTAALAVVGLDYQHIALMPAREATT